MKNSSIFSLTFLFSVLLSCTVQGQCPAGISPCTCQDPKDGGVLVQCSSPASGPRVTSALETMSQNQQWDLHLNSMNLVELPPTVKSVMSLRLSNCVLGRLLKTSSVLVWPKLNEVVIESSRIVEDPWSQLKGARILQSLKVSDFSMRSIGQSFRKVPPSVEYLDLRKTGTTRLEPGCMAHLTNLLYVFMADMPLAEFPRAALPTELSQLHTFILGNTLIEKLEPNFFDGMPKLEVLMLNGNKFTTLSSHLFMPLKTHLTHLLAERNPLQCDCNLLWLKKNFQHKRTIKVMATCYDASLKEFRAVMKINEEDYC
ncbi:hypothetical protein JTE90_001108 [Oedothorax gibbosus]|uniref:Uncharacterized protein n=1 Tax=Oedothorax gibbosus TaxID=931172 RepID=A0AAV6VGG5_9ARAC|nr:hypothetical protein JTE90_001108 [Oedothorax gibbosus]